MTTLQRLLSNTLLAFTSNIIVRVSNSLLFIFIGRTLGPTEAGAFNLGITYFTVVFALSAWGLHELLVREVATRRDESGRYLVNYLFLRLGLAAGGYLLLIVALRVLLPYSQVTTAIIRILALAVFPEAIFAMVQALFEAHERLLPPALAATANSVFKLGGGLWLLIQGYPVRQIVWVVPIGSALSLLIFLPFLWRLFGPLPKGKGRWLNWSFSLAQLKETPSFLVIHLFSLLDYQTDAFLISLLLTETAVGWYGAAQTVLLGFWMIPMAVRAALYPLMARYHRTDRDKLAVLYRKSSQYLVLFALPVAAGVYLIAPGLIQLIFKDSFDPAIPALRWSIWAVGFALLNVPNARLMLVYNKQRQAAWLTGLSMVVNVSANLLLIPRYEIVGAAMARTFASFIFFVALYIYVQRNLLRASILPGLIRPVLATATMVLLVEPVRALGMIPAIATGIIVYGLAGVILRVIPAEDWHYWRTLYKSSAKEVEVEEAEEVMVHE